MEDVMHGGGDAAAAVIKQHDDAIESLRAHSGRIFILGGVDCGKTSDVLDPEVAWRAQVSSA